MVKDDTRVETGNDDDDNKSVNEIGDKENSVCENVVDRLETGNDDDDNKSVDEMRDKENSLCEKGVVGTEMVMVAHQVKQEITFVNRSWMM